MPTKTDKKTASESPASTPHVACAVIFGLEDIACNGRQTVFEVMKKALAGVKIELTTELFARYGAATGPVAALGNILAAQEIKAGASEKVLQEFTRQLTAAFTAHPPKPSAPLLKLLGLARDLNLSVAAYSLLPEELAQSLCQQLDLGPLTKFFTYKDQDKAFPRADTWLKMARALSRQPKSCLALVSNGQACKSALFADLYCVVVADEFTAFQDFGGAYSVLEDLGELDAKTVLPDLFPSLRP